MKSTLTVCIRDPILPVIKQFQPTPNCKPHSFLQVHYEPSKDGRATHSATFMRGLEGARFGVRSLRLREPPLVSCSDMIAGAGDMSELPKLVNPSGWPPPSGYSNAMVAEGKMVAIAGQIGWDPITEKLVSTDFVQQTRQALANVHTALEAAGARPEHLVRLTWYITDRSAYLANLKQIGEAYHEEIGVHYPAMSVLVVAGLLEQGAKVEIEATAIL